jgi:hypothetical protein
MKKLFSSVISIFFLLFAFSQKKSDTWKIVADKINPQDYYGVTVANGVIGIVSSLNVLRCKDVVLNGAYDQYGRGRVSNFLQSFNLVNMNMDIDGQRITNVDIYFYCIHGNLRMHLYLYPISYPHFKRSKNKRI